MNERRNQVIIIPAYNPSDVLIDLVEELSEYFYRIVVVDDGGGEDYKALFDKVQANLCCTVLRHYVNMGKGRALKTAFNYCISLGDECSGAITVDADGQHTVEDILRISDAMSKNESKAVLGCRKFEDKEIPFRSRFGNNVSRVVYKWLCGINVSDTQTGLRGIPRELFGIMCCLNGERYEYETNMLLALKENEIEIVEVPISTIYEDGNSSSHFNPLKDSWRIYSVILKYSLSSLLSVIIDYIVFVVLTRNQVGIMYSTYIARGCAAGINFCVNRNVVFKKKGKIGIQLAKYLLLVMIAGTVSGVAISIMKRFLPINVVWTKALVETVLYFINYYIQRTYIFIRGENSK
ncbi:MAG: bifunctional glycosyltransferase family 2/GtrA family protein [Lachnospiraceae bacterium]